MGFIERGLLCDILGSFQCSVIQCSGKKLETRCVEDEHPQVESCIESGKRESGGGREGESRVAEEKLER